MRKAIDLSPPCTDRITHVNNRLRYLARHQSKNADPKINTGRELPVRESVKQGLTPKAASLRKSQEAEQQNTEE